MKTLNKVLMLAVLTIMLGCSFSRWFAKAEHLPSIDGTMAVSFWILITTILIEAYDE